MQFGQFHRMREKVGIDTMPLLNLFVTLIPFLLLASAVYHIGFAGAFLPEPEEAASIEPKNPRAVVVNLFVEPTKIELTTTLSTHKARTEAKSKNPPGLSLVLKNKGQGFDLKNLGKALHEIKLLYDESDTLVLLPSDEVAYEDVIKILETAREITFNRGTREELTIPLFPVVVFSRKV